MKSKFLVIAMLLFFILGIFYSCEENGIEPVIKNAVLIPLQIGNEWTYKQTNLVSSYPDSFSIDTFKHTINEKEEKNNEVWFWRAFDNDSAFVRLINRDNGLFIVVFDDQEMQFANYPIRLGDSVLFSTFLRTHESGQIVDTMYTYKKITSINSIIKVPAGTFKCLEITDILYHQNNQNIEGEVHREYYSLNIGLIKNVDFSNDIKGNEKLIRSMELISYKLK